MDDMILGGTHMDVAKIRHPFVNPTIKYNQGRCRFMLLQEGTLTPPIYRVLYCIIPKENSSPLTQYLHTPISTRINSTALCFVLCV